MTAETNGAKPPPWKGKKFVEKNGRKLWLDEFKDYVVARYKSGEKGPPLAADLGLRVDQVYKWLDPGDTRRSTAAKGADFSFSASGDAKDEIGSLDSTMGGMVAQLNRLAAKQAEIRFAAAIEQICAITETAMRDIRAVAKAVMKRGG